LDGDVPGGASSIGDSTLKLWEVASGRVEKLRGKYALGRFGGFFPRRHLTVSRAATKLAETFGHVRLVASDKKSAGSRASGKREFLRSVLEDH